MLLKDRFIAYLQGVRRLSARTVSIYEEAIDRFISYIISEDGAEKDSAVSDAYLTDSLSVQMIRAYQVHLLDTCSLSARTVNLHLSVLSTFSAFLVKKGLLKSNPVKLVTRPKTAKRLPVFYRRDALKEYFSRSKEYASPESLMAMTESDDPAAVRYMYERRLARLVISMLYSLGLRRAELIGIDLGDVNFGRKVVKVHGKGDKMREIPMIDSLCEEISLYLRALMVVTGTGRSLKEPLLVTYSGNRLYPVYVDRIVKREFADVQGIKGRKSPHVLRHSIATQLLDKEADLNSIKEFLGHSSLAVTQIYTHNTTARLKHIYKRAHPRAKNGGKHGD